MLRDRLLARYAVIVLLVGAAYARASGIEAGVDAGVQPGDDFFAYANGA